MQQSSTYKLSFQYPTRPDRSTSFKAWLATTKLEEVERYGNLKSHKCWCNHVTSQSVEKRDCFLLWTGPMKCKVQDAWKCIMHAARSFVICGVLWWACAWLNISQHNRSLELWCSPARMLPGALSSRGPYVPQVTILNSNSNFSVRSNQWTNRPIGFVPILG